MGRAVVRILRGEPHFRWRGGEVSRIETLADAVFAFALTLLVVSLEVPSTFDELLLAVQGFPAFAACFALLTWIWYHHFLFHRRFGLETAGIVWLDAALLFTVLFYVYPLKFMARFLQALIVGDMATVRGALRLEQSQALMTFYAGGFTAIFVMLAVLNVIAYRRRDLLRLDAAERLVVLQEIRMHALSAGIGSLSLGLTALGPQAVAWAGFAFGLLGPVHAVHGMWTGRAIERAAAAAGVTPDTAQHPS
jgi:uncharacterized membrane protein